MRACAQRHHLTHALGCTHDIGGIDRLVRRYHHKTFHAVRFAQVNDVFRSKDVVFNRLQTVVLHQRDVLVRRRMDHNLRMISGEHLLHRR